LTRGEGFLNSLNGGLGGVFTDVFVEDVEGWAGDPDDVRAGNGLPVRFDLSVGDVAAVGQDVKVDVP
jgi:hypothetical protein